MKRRRQSGFSVIEALAAMAIVAMALLPLASLQGQVSRAGAHQQTVRERIAAERNAMALLRDINVMDEQSGMRRLSDDLVLRWTATPVSRAVRTNLGSFEVALFTVRAELVRGDGAPVAAFALEQIGWRAIADASPG